MIDETRLKILTESAKYDVSCSSSGSQRKNAANGIGNAYFSGICHSFTEDGRCISLLKILLSNDCIYDCQYCINRRTNDLARATATPDEICELAITFYKRNYIEGLFLSSAIFKSPDTTMELLLETVMKLRNVYNFNGYIHLKGIPKADFKLISQAGEYVDRMSFNIELPSEKSLKLLAPQKSKSGILEPMRNLALTANNSFGYKQKKFLPAGQTTQMIVGASPESDGQIVRLSQALYKNYGLKRVYYSSYVPTNRDNSLLPTTPVGLLREHRLYQADWLMRFYGFNAEELIDTQSNFAEEYDPKCAWAMNNMQLFPVEINTAPPEMLVRVPGIGFKSAYKIVNARRYTNLGYTDLMKMRVVLKRAIHFITIGGKFFGQERLSNVKKLLTIADNEQSCRQLSMFSDTEIKKEVLTGQL